MDAKVMVKSFIIALLKMSKNKRRFSLCLNEFLQDTTDALLCHIHLPVCLWIMDPHSTAPKKNANHGNEMLPQGTTHLIQITFYQRGSPCQDPAGNRTTRRSPDHCKETHTAVLYTCLPSIRSGQNHFPKPSERGEEDKENRGRGGKLTSGN